MIAAAPQHTWMKNKRGSSMARQTRETQEACNPRGLQTSKHIEKRAHITSWAVFSGGHLRLYLHSKCLILLSAVVVVHVVSCSLLFLSPLFFIVWLPALNIPLLPSSRVCLTLTWCIIVLFSIYNLYSILQIFKGLVNICSQILYLSFEVLIYIQNMSVILLNHQ